MKSKTEIIDIARTWIDTPWKHNQYTKGVGVDCVRFLEAIALESDVSVPPLPVSYPRVDTTRTILKYLKEHFTKIPIEQIDITDILLIKVDGLLTHTGIYSGDGYFIHASNHKKIMRVIELPLDDTYLRNVHSVWRFDN
jgi:cell wall-associated NlpC family hydrolase